MPLVCVILMPQDAVDAYAAYKELERQLADAKELLKESEGAPAWRCWQHFLQLLSAAAVCSMSQLPGEVAAADHTLCAQAAVRSWLYAHFPSGHQLQFGMQVTSAARLRVCLVWPMPSVVHAGDPEMAELARDEMETLQQQIDEQVRPPWATAVCL